MAPRKKAAAALDPVPNGALNVSDPVPASKLNENTDAPTTNGDKKAAPTKRKRAADDAPAAETTSKRPKREVKTVEAVVKEKTVATKKGPTKAAAKTKETKTVVKKTTTATTTKKAAVTKKEVAAKEPKKAAAKPAAKKEAVPKPAAEKKAKIVKPKAEKPPKAPKVEKPAEPLKPKVPAVLKRGPFINQFATRATEPLVVLVTGRGEMGELGLGPTVGEVKRPRVNAFLPADTVGVVDAACGGMHTLVLTKNNEIWSWGVNDHGALGRNTDYEAPEKDMDAESDSGSEDVDLNPKESTPGQVEGLPADEQFVRIAAGDSISVAVTATGHVYQWGTFRSSDGILGFDQEKMTSNTPTLIPDIGEIVDVAAGTDHVLALSRNGKVYAWGSGGQFQLGRRVIERRARTGLIPMDAGIPKKIVSIGAGSYHSFAIDVHGEVWAWGLNQFVQCGELAPKQVLGEETNSILDKPTRISALSGKGVVQIIGGEHHSLALCKNGDVYVWGRADGAEIGIELDTLPEDNVFRGPEPARRVRFVHVPTLIPGLKASKVAAGTHHNLAIGAEDKATYSWGFAESSQTGQGANIEYVTRPTKIDNTASRDLEIKWIGAGGQFSVIGGVPKAGTAAAVPATAPVAPIATTNGDVSSSAEKSS